MRTKILPFIILLLMQIPVMAQSVSGYVYDAAGDFPLEGAFVYLDGTTYSASTNSEGAFTINVGQQLSAALVVKYIGYQTAIIQNPFSYQTKIKVTLKEDTIKMDELVISGETVFSRKEMLAVFREQFLGKTKAGNSCKILNEDDIRLYYEVATNTLRAESDKPIRIQNKRLKYNVEFDLVDFQVHYTKKTLSPFSMQTSYYAGTSFFKDVSEKENIKKKRDEVYRGSLLHFMRTIASNRWTEEHYGLFVESMPVNPADYFKVTDTLDYKKVTCLKTTVKVIERHVGVRMTGMSSSEAEKALQAPKERKIRFAVLQDQVNQSFFELNADHFYIGENGLFWPISSIIFGGYFGELKVGDMLPADYTYTAD